MILNFWIGLGAALALIYGAAYCWRGGNGWTRSAVKTGSMACLAVASVALGAPVWVVAGLALGALGDFCLSRPGQAAFLAGMAAFALGHLAYATYFMGLSGTFGPFSPMVAPFIFFAATTEFWLVPHTGALRWPVRAYVVMITLMGVAALLQWDLVLLAGAGLFILSDVLLALVLFVMPAARLRWVLAVALWAAYWLGQFLILQGGLAAISAA